jgi:hypothetical protein
MTIDKQNPQLSSSEKAALKKAKHKIFVAAANPQLSLEKKQKNDAKRERRQETGSTKSFK